jgi:hypothetical protein
MATDPTVDTSVCMTNDQRFCVKVNKVADLKDIERAELAGYPESSHPHAFVLTFFDKSSITFAAHSLGALTS